MKNRGALGYPPREQLFVDCCDAIYKQNYRDALYIIKNGLLDLLQSTEEYNNRKLIENFCTIFDVLEVTLKEAYGDRWEHRVGIPALARREEGAEMSCSFCGKPGSEVAQMIEGEKVKICNECVEICNEIIGERNNLKAGRA